MTLKAPLAAISRGECSEVPEGQALKPRTQIRGTGFTVAPFRLLPAGIVTVCRLSSVICHP